MESAESVVSLTTSVYVHEMTRWQPLGSIRRTAYQSGRVGPQYPSVIRAGQDDQLTSVRTVVNLCIKLLT
jgi:hypothetical protein